MDFADRAGLDREMSDLFLDVVRSLDAQWLTWKRETRK